MKRWQDCGEVLDSDEEAWSIDEEPSDQEPVRKRARTDDGETHTQATQVQEAEDHSEVEQALGEGQHGLRHAEETFEDVSPADGQSDEDRAGEEAHRISQGSDEELLWQRGSHAVTYAQRGKMPKRKTVRARGLIPVIARSEQDDAVTGQSSNAAHSVGHEDLSRPQDPVTKADAAQDGRDPTTTQDAAMPTSEPLVFGDPSSRASTPLSDPPESPQLPPSDVAMVTYDQRPIEETRRVRAGSVDSDLAIHPEAVATPPTQGPGGRSLRMRNEKQLHPYLYEAAMYRRQCRERGIKPVKAVVDQIMNKTPAVQRSSSDDGDQPVSSQAPPSSSMSSSDAAAADASSLSPAPDGMLPALTTPGSDDDLPDIDALIKRSQDVVHRHSNKRQKLTHPKRHIHNQITAQGHRRAHQDEFSVPPSPPTSSHDSASSSYVPKRPTGFRLPRGMSPLPLPTPQISSETRPSHTKTSVVEGGVQSSTEDWSPPRTARVSSARRSNVIAISDESSSSHSDSASDNEEGQLERQRRRIRGVLPASWLRMDQKAQTKGKPREDHRTAGSPVRAGGTQKGVARKLPARRVPSPSRVPLVFSDEEDSQASGTQTPSAKAHTNDRAAAEQLALDAFPTATVDDDDMEADFIDPMLAGSSRPKKDPIFSKRQPRIHDALSRVRNGSDDLSEERNAFRRMQGAPNVKRVRRKRKTAPRQVQRISHVQLGILDAPSSPETTTSKQPQFVRVAARQARQSANRGRGSPSHKAIRLAAHGDTMDANATLRAWRQGKLPQRSVEPPKRRLAPGNARSSGPQASSRAEYHTEARVEHQRLVTTLVTSSPTATAVDISPAEPRAPGDRLTGYMQHTLAESGPRQRGARPTVQYRGAQLESVAEGQDRAGRESRFQHRIQCLTEAVSRRARTPAQPLLPMARLLQDNTPPAVSEHPRVNAQATQVEPQAGQADRAVTRGLALPCRPRKRPATRIDVDVRELRQPSEPLPDFGHLITVDDDRAPAQATIHGLGPLGTRYSTDFDIRPLPQGTFFHQSTFIGSGDLAVSLQLDARDLDAGTGSLRIYINGVMHEWSAWTEEVSSAAAGIPGAITSVLRDHAAAPASQQADQVAVVVSNVDHMLRSSVRYLSKCVRFYDPIDRESCAQCIKDLVDGVLEIDNDHDSWTDQTQRLRQRVLQYALVLARQCRSLCESSLVPPLLRSASDESLKAAAMRLGALLIPGSMDELRNLCELCRSTTVRESGLRDDDSVLAGIVVLSHCLAGRKGPSPLFWEAVRHGSTLTVSATNVATFERCWYELFTVLPALGFDALGLINTRQDPHASHCDWNLPKQMLESCFELYPATSAMPGSSINDYIRALLTRCYKLVMTWGWWPCETALGSIYDFFARRGLCLLQREEGKGSPAFLEEASPTAMDHIEISPGDHSFHLFLKLLASALVGMRRTQVYPDKKISGIIWRFIPNHARMYRRDAEVKQDDLDALRNHCDLLCTLYTASPPAYRLRLDLLSNLVDHSNSHREACRISVKAWAHVTSFQMSTIEPLGLLDAPAQWYRQMFQTTVNQYRLARIEAEQEYAKAQTEGRLGMTAELLEHTVASNQRRIAATLVDLIAALKRAVGSARTVGAATYLLRHAALWQAISTTSMAERRLHPLFHEVVDLIKKVQEVSSRLVHGEESQTASDDSQDYGDLAALEEFAATQGAPAPGPDVIMLVLEPVSQLLSNAFGAELSPGHELLTKIVDEWVNLAWSLVKKGLRSWSNFIDDYSPGAWLQLRDTEQRRTYTPYVLSRLVETDQDAPKQLTDTIFATWLRSLVDRESRLKFQHVLTSALMNACPDEPILRNLPFSRAFASHAYNTTLQDFRDRRLALLSSVLSNMRESFDDILYNRPQALPALRRRYGGYLRQLMQAMKNNYQDVQAANDQAVAEAGVSGAYVGFVQQVVSFLQQYTTDICAIDKFFVDSSAFPLPATDPTYVVGKLRSYVPKLAEAKYRKQLAVFVHTVSERAVVDGQQVYLINQFVAAMSGVLEQGDFRTPSLRHVLLTSIFPAYIEAALSTACSWILAVPILEASARTIMDLLYDIDLNRGESVATAVAQIEAVLRSTQRAMAPALVHLGLLGLPHVQRALTAMFNFCQASLTVSGHIQRVSGPAVSLGECLGALRTYAEAIKAQMSGAEAVTLFDPPAHAPTGSESAWLDTFAFSKKQLQDSLVNNWHANDGQYYLRQGNSSTEVVAPLAEDDEERRRLLTAIADFQIGLKRQKHRKRRVEAPRMSGII